MSNSCAKGYLEIFALAAANLLIAGKIREVLKAGAYRNRRDSHEPQASHPAVKPL